MRKLHNFRDLIAAIPIGRHAEEIRSDFWKNEFEAARLTDIYKNIFNSEPTVRISRDKILKTPNGLEKCALVLLWGYTTGMRGNQHRKYLSNLEKIAEACSVTDKTWESFYKNTKHIGNLGISTITKLAYFHSLKFDDSPALILDQRIIDILAKKNWEELESLSNIKYGNAGKRYIDYLQEMKRVAFNLKVEGSQLEFFLFGMGNKFD